MTDYDHTTPVNDLAMSNRTLTIGSFVHTVPPTNMGPPGDQTPPTVGSFTPAVGASLGPTDAIAFTVEDETALSSVAIMAFFATAGLYEVVWDGEDFGPAYAEQSTRVATDDGFRFTLRRASGWPESPELKMLLIDIAGNITV